MRDEQADYERVVAWLTDPEVMHYWDGLDRPGTMEGVLAKYGPRIREEVAATPCLIELEGAAIGYMQFYRPMDWPDWGNALGEDRDPDRWALDIVIGQPELWNKGLGTRAVRMLLAYLFDQKAATEVVLDALAWNTRAIRCYEKAGFRKVRLLPKSELHEGEYQDAWLLKAGPG